MTKSKVYLIPAAGDDPADAIAAKAKAAYLATGFNGLIAAGDFTALKIHFGEKGNRGHIRAAWLPGVVDEVRSRAPRAFLTDSNTLYTGARSNAVDHIRLAWEHGFRPEVLDVPVIIADGLIGGDVRESRGEAGHVAAAKISGAVRGADAMLVLTHVTGHLQTGIGASIKNMGMGCASRAGKLDQHASSHPRIQAKSCRDCGLCREHCAAGAIRQLEGRVEIDDGRCTGCGECMVVCKFGAVRWRWDEDVKRVQEKVAEYAKLVQDHFRGKIAFLNFILHVTKDCDCMATSQRPIVSDVGIVASRDAVAADKASADLVLRQAGKDPFRAGYDLDWSLQMRHGQKIGLGSLDYELIELGRD
jgi:hypothetical protein